MQDVEQLPLEGVICGDIGAKYNITLAQDIGIGS